MDQDRQDKLETFGSELEKLVNKYSQENASNTPDFLLAQYLVRCLENWNVITVARERWYGRTDNVVPDALEMRIKPTIPSLSVTARWSGIERRKAVERRKAEERKFDPLTDVIRD